MINNVVLVGRLTKDPELKYTGNGIAVVTFTVAVNRPFKSQGEDDADFINCVAWRKTAENTSNYTRKGSLVGITGRIQTRNYTNNEGRKIFITEVVAENVQFLEPKSSRQTESNPAANDYTQNNKNATGGNFGSNNKQQNNPSFDNKKADPEFTSVDDPFATNSGNENINISDDDLPF